MYLRYGEYGGHQQISEPGRGGSDRRMLRVCVGHQFHVCGRCQRVWRPPCPLHRLRRSGRNQTGILGRSISYVSHGSPLSVVSSVCRDHPPAGQCSGSADAGCHSLFPGHPFWRGAPLSEADPDQHHSGNGKQRYPCHVIHGGCCGADFSGCFSGCRPAYGNYRPGACHADQQSVAGPGPCMVFGKAIRRPAFLYFPLFHTKGALSGYSGQRLLQGTSVFIPVCRLFFHAADGKQPADRSVGRRRLFRPVYLPVHRTAQCLRDGGRCDRWAKCGPRQLPYDS